jgi:hypothetical protein
VNGLTRRPERIEVRPPSPRSADHLVPAETLGAPERRLLARYVDAFERHDMTQLTSLIHADIALSTQATCG